MTAFCSRTARATAAGLTLIAALTVGLSLGESSSAPNTGPRGTNEHVTRTTTVDFTWPKATPVPSNPVNPGTAGV